MKCKYCGGDVTLDDRFCPHCGRPVEQALRHKLEMEYYESEFEEARQEALEKVEKSGISGTAVGIRLAAIAALIVLLIIMALNLDPYEMNKRRKTADANRNYEVYTAQIEEYLANRDYIALYSFCSDHELRFNDKYKLYDEIFSSVSRYEMIYWGLQQLVFTTDDSRELYSLKSLSRNINEFYNDLDNHYFWTEDTDKVDAVNSEIEEDILVLLRRYLGLSREEADSLKTLSDSKRTVLIEQAIDAKLSESTGSSLSEMEEEFPSDAGSTGGE